MNKYDFSIDTDWPTYGELARATALYLVPAFVLLCAAIKVASIIG